MTWPEALEIVIARTRHDRYRFFCSEANPCAYSRAAFRDLMLALATGEDPPRAESDQVVRPDPPPTRPCCH